MTGVLILEGVELGYCDQCGRACVPGVFRVFNWHHKFRVCDVCLTQLSSNVGSMGNMLLKQPRKEGGD